MSRGVNDATFWEYMHSKYEGKIHKIERMHTPDFSGLDVHLVFRIPEGDADEIEIFRRIAKVIDVIAEGDDGKDRVSR
jgi:hypothetical protein